MKVRFYFCFYVNEQKKITVHQEKVTGQLIFLLMCYPLKYFCKLFNRIIWSLRICSVFCFVINKTRFLRCFIDKLKSVPVTTLNPTLPLITEKSRYLINWTFKSSGGFTFYEIILFLLAINLISNILAGHHLT